MINTVKEGKASYLSYSLLQADGVTPVASVESLKYKVSDGVTDLVDWTTIASTATGTITIPGQINRIGSSGITMRYLTLFAVHDGGNHLPEEIEYKILDQKGITSATVPLI